VLGPGAREIEEDSKDFYITGLEVKTGAPGDGRLFDRERVVSDT